MGAELRAAIGWNAPAQLRVLRAPDPDERAAFWRINGYRVKLLVWTQSEWKTLATRPCDAQYHPCGVWCALRLEESR